MQVTHLVARGPWEDAQLKEGLELCMGGCLQLDGAMRQCLKEAAAAKQQQMQQQQQQQQQQRQQQPGGGS